jgi:hypothetical protein
MVLKADVPGLRRAVSMTVRIAASMRTPGLIRGDDLGSAQRRHGLLALGLEAACARRSRFISPPWLMVTPSPSTESCAPTRPGSALGGCARRSCRT